MSTLAAETCYYDLAIDDTNTEFDSLFEDCDNCTLIM